MITDGPKYNTVPHHNTTQGIRKIIAVLPKITAVYQKITAVYKKNANQQIIILNILSAACSQTLLPAVSF